MTISRRDLLHGLGGAISAPLLLSRADAEVTPDVLRFRPEIEPLVALIERTPREKCAEMAVDRLRNGVSYRQFLAALFLAGVRNVNPRPPGFALHCVFVVHSAHLVSMEAPPDSRLLPLFYVLDDFKAAQERDARQPAGDFTMREVRGSLPGPDRAAAELSSAMDAWDQERAERAVVTLARHRAASDVFAMLWRWGARDYRNIGHKAIYVANAYRTLHAIGWQHAEPVLRSLVLALLDFGAEQEMNGYRFADQVYNANLKRQREMFAKLSDAWISGAADASATRDILGIMRAGSPDEACAGVADRLVKGKASAASVWDAIHLAAAELRLRAQSGAALVSIHAVTSANGLHYGFLEAPDPRDRFLLLLQAVGWMGQFRKFAEARPNNLRERAITDLEPGEEAPLDRALSETFTEIPSKPDAAASRVFRMARNDGARDAFLASALRFTLAKVNEVHYYKYLAALIEDVALVSPEWQPYLLATMVYYIKGANDPEPPAMKRAREAMRGLAAG
jgi:hypothetical protein